MDSTPASRFIDLLGRLGYRTQQEIADLLDIARPTVSTMMRQKTDPSFAAVARLKEKHPEANVEWVFSGMGSAFLTGNERPQHQQPALTVIARPSQQEQQQTADSELARLFLEQIARAEEQIKEVRKEARRQQDVQIRLMQATIDSQHRNILNLEESVQRLESQITQMAQRPLTAAEQALQNQQQGVTPPVAGLRRYDDPQGGPTNCIQIDFATKRRMEEPACEMRAAS